MDSLQDGHLSKRADSYVGASPIGETLRAIDYIMTISMYYGTPGEYCCEKSVHEHEVYLDRFGCKFRSNLTGIIYNNHMADFDTPNDTKNKIDGVYPSEVNFPEPGKRPFSSLSPAILTDNNSDVQLVIGASGGKKITTAVSLV